MADRGHLEGVGVACQERLDLLLALGPEHGAGAIQQAATRLDQWPEGLQQTALLGRQLIDISWPAQPATALCPGATR